MSVQMERILDLEKRVEILEKKQNAVFVDKLERAISEFMYMKKTDEQSEAWEIIFPILMNYKKEILYG